MAGRRESGHGSPWAQSATEWIAAGMGLAALLVITGTLLFEVITGNGHPPRISAQAGEITAQDGVFHIPVELTNHGSRTGAGVLVVGELRDGEGEVVEEAEFELDFLPPRSTRRGGLYFDLDPHDFELSISPRGYHYP